MSDPSKNSLQRSRTGQLWPLLVVVGGVLTGLVVAVAGPNTWRLGSLLIGASLLVGAVIRLALPNRQAGLLQVRSRVFDLIALTVGGAAIIALAIVVPNH